VCLPNRTSVSSVGAELRVCRDDTYDVAMKTDGFTLIELLLATALLIAVSGAIVLLAVPARHAVERSVVMDEMSTGSRAALELLTAEIRAAGASAAVGADFGARSSVLAPLADLASNMPGARSTALRITSVPRDAAQGVLLTAANAADTTLALDLSARCANIGPACGFRGGDRVVIADDVSVAFVTVAAASSLGVLVVSPLPVPFTRGASIAVVERVTYGIRADGDGSHELIRVSTGGAIQPLLRRVVAFAVTMDANIATLQLRVEAPPAFRGPAGALFARAGTATNAHRWLPDLDLHVLVSLRNVAP
jgi:type II secretory pathway pseudopilin PulG